MQTTSDFWILRPFNAVFNLTAALFVLLLIVSSLALRGKSEKTRQNVLIGACIVTTIGFIVYKYFLSIDQEFNAATAAMGGFNWWGELPLQLCNINMLLIPIAVARKSRPLMSFSFFLGPLGAMMALAMPVAGFSGYSILLPRMLGFYGTHFMVLIEGLALATFGLYRPRFRDLPHAALTVIVIAFCIFLINVLLRVSGAHPKANYFFTMETEGNALLEIFHSWIPVPYLYLFPSIGILAVYALLVTTPFEIADRLKKKKTAKA